MLSGSAPAAEVEDAVARLAHFGGRVRLGLDDGGLDEDHQLLLHFGSAPAAEQRIEARGVALQARQARARVRAVELHQPADRDDGAVQAAHDAVGLAYRAAGGRQADRAAEYR